MVLDYYRFHFWTCKVLGLPVSLDMKTRVYYISRWSPIPTLILLVICTISSLFLRVNVGEHHLNELIFNSDFHRFVGWFQIKFDCSITIVLLLLMVILRKELVIILNTRTRIYRLLSEMYLNIRMPSYRQLYSKQVLILWSFLIVKTVDFYAEMRDVLVDGPLDIPSIAILCQVKFPILVFTLVNNLFLENVSFLIIFLRKLHQVVREGITRVSVKAHQRCQLSDLIDEMAQVYAAIHQHKITMTRIISCAMVLLFVPRFFDMVTRMFYIYSAVTSYRLSKTFNYKLTTCHVVDLLVTIAELSFICNGSERIFEEASFLRYGPRVILHKLLNCNILQTEKLVESVVKCTHEKEDRVKESAELFALQLLHQRMEFVVCGMFSLTKRFTSEVCTGMR